MKNVVGPTPREITSSKLLLGEGREEELFFKALLEALTIPGVQVESYGGKEKLAGYLVTLPTRPGFAELRSLAITRDADLGYEGALQSMRSALQGAKLDAPWVHTYVLPGPNRTGALEDLCFGAVSETPLAGCVEAYLLCAERAGFTGSQSMANKAKARIHTWLAAQDPPDLRLGLAARKFDFSNDAFEGLRSFLRRAFV